MATEVKINNGTSLRVQTFRRVNGQDIRRSKCFKLIDGKLDKASLRAKTQWILDNEEAAAPTNKRITLHEAFDRFRNEVSSTKRSEDGKGEPARIDRLKRQFADCDISAVTAEDIEKWVKERKAAVKESTASREFATLKAFFTKCSHKFGKNGTGWRYIEVNPTDEVKKPADGDPRDVLISEKELADFRAECRTDLERRAGHALAFACETGLRLAELTFIGNTRKCRVYDGYLQLLPGHTKNQKQRIVPFSSKADKLIVKEGYGLTKRQITWAIQEVTARLGYTFTCHAARHTAATKIGNDGKLSTFELCAMFGWSDLKVAQRYIRNDVQSVRAKLG